MSDNSQNQDSSSPLSIFNHEEHFYDSPELVDVRTSIKKEKEKKWFAQHFPVGTLVKFEGFKRVTREGKEEIVTDHSECYKKFGVTMTVQKVIQVSPTNLLIQTTQYNEACGMFHTFNVQHLASIVKRGDGPVLVEYHSRSKEAFNTKRYISNGPFNKNRYYSSSLWEIVIHLISNSHLPKDLSVREEFIDFFMKQSFLKREILIPDMPTWKFFSVDKKRAKRFVQQNINRWIKPMKQAHKEAEEEAERESQNYFDDFDDLDWPDLTVNKTLDSVGENKQTLGRLSFNGSDDQDELSGLGATPMGEMGGSYRASEDHDTGVMSLGEILRKKLEGENVFAPKE